MLRKALSRIMRPQGAGGQKTDVVYVSGYVKQRYEVEARSEKEAKQKYENGEATKVDEQFQDLTVDNVEEKEE